MKKAVERLLKNSNLKLFLKDRTPALRTILVSSSAGTEGLESNLSRLEMLNAQDIQTYLDSNRAHKDMMDRYWPVNGLSAEEKLKRTANAVGFELPKQGSPLSDLERSSMQDTSMQDTEALLSLLDRQRKPTDTIQ